MTEDYVTIKNEDGVPCKDRASCPIPNPFTKQKKLLQAFEQRSVVRDLFDELTTLLKPNEHGVTEETKIEEFWKRIQNLQGDERKVFNLEQEGKAFFFWLFEGINLETKSFSLKKIVKFILEKYHPFINLNMLDDRGNSLLDVIQYSGKFRYTEEYSIFKMIYSYLPTEEARVSLFLRPEKENACPLFIDAAQMNYALLKFYIDSFGPKLKDLVYYVSRFGKGNLLHRVMLDPIHSSDLSISPDKKQCIKLLLLNGVDPNQTISVDLQRKEELADQLKTPLNAIPDPPSVKPLELYLTFYYPPYEKELIKLFYTYGMKNENSFLQEQIKRWEIYLPFDNQKTLSLLSVIQALKENIQNLVEQYEYDGAMRGGMPWHYNNNNNYNNRNRYSNNSYGYSSGYDSQHYYSLLSSDEVTLFSTLRKSIADIVDFHPFLGPILLTDLQQFMENVIYFHKNPFSKNGKSIFVDPITIYKECLLIRKAYGKHGSKFKRTRKQNKEIMNKTLKNNLNILNFEADPDKQINELLSSILELVKKPQFTREEKTLFKKRAIDKKQSQINNKAKRNDLRTILEEMKGALAGR